MRNAHFETIFPVPKGVAYFEETNDYFAFRDYAQHPALRQSTLWIGYQAALGRIHELEGRVRELEAGDE